MTTKTIIKQLEKRLVAVGEERDKLRALIADVEDLAETCDHAHDALQEAVYALSELA